MDSFIRFKFFYSLKILLFFWNYFILIKFFLEIGFILPILKVISSETYPRKTTDANWCFHWMVRTLSSCRITFEKDAKFICGGAQLPIFRSRPFGFLPVFQHTGAQQHDGNFYPSIYISTNTKQQCTLTSCAACCHWLKYLQKDKLSVVRQCARITERNPMVSTLVRACCDEIDELADFKQ